MKVREFWGGEEERENKGNKMQRGILRIVKEEQKKIKPRILGYILEVIAGLEEGL